MVGIPGGEVRERTGARPPAVIFIYTASALITQIMVLDGMKYRFLSSNDKYKSAPEFADKIKEIAVNRRFHLHGGGSAHGMGGVLSLAACGALAMLAGCGQKGGDAAPALAKQQAVLRIDQFQAAASNGKLAVAVGGRVAVVSEVDGARSLRVTLPGTPALIDVASCADGSFAALDFYRKVWFSDNSATHWAPRSISGNWRPLALTCDTHNKVWVVGSGTTIASSADQGVSWEQRDFKEDAMFNSVQFVDGDNGFITGEFGAVYRTIDGGANWNAAPRIPNDFYPYAALFVSPLEGYVSGLAGAMLRTVDGARSWTTLDNPGALPQFGLARQAGAIYSVGMGGSLQRLDNNRWTALDYGTQAPAFLRGIAPAGADRLLIAGALGAFKLVPASAVATTLKAE
jgi:photosystem II stability/assembly factor-like uncharacterized protein